MEARIIFDFLTQLKLNNNRDWFQANKKTYEAARKEMEAFVSEMIVSISAIDPQLQSPAMKDCVFRIFRDVRFATDKSPYKTNLGAFIAKGGRKSMNPGYYFHFEPGESFVAAGVYMPSPEVLKMLRNEIYYHSSEFKAILSKPSFVKHFKQLDEFDKMKKAPRDFPADFPDIDLLKYRSYIVSCNRTDAQAAAPGYKEELLTIVKELQPFMAFLNRAILNG
jgi:uncharacterized protein (TIGR02453 family)